VEDAFPFLESATNLVEALRAQHPPEAIAAWFAGRAIIGDVDLSGLAYPHRLALRGCMFWGRVTMEDAHFGNTLDLSDCQFDKGLNLNTARIEGNLVLERCKFGVLGPSRFRPDDTDALSLWQVEVRGAVLLFAAHLKARLNMRESRVVGRLTLNGLRLASDIDLVSAEIGADLYCRSLSEQAPRPEIGGQVWMSGTKVGGQADFSGARITGDLDLQGAEIGAALYCCSRSEQEPRPEIGGRVFMLGTKVGGQADFSGARITDDLDLQGAEIGAALFCCSLSKQEPRPEIGGQVFMSSTKVGGQAVFNGARITGDLDLQNAEIGAALLCRSLSEQEPRPEIGGRVRMLGTKVGGTAQFSGAHIKRDLFLGNTQFGADFDAASPREPSPRTQIGGTVSFTGTRVEGVTTFVGAKINGGFSAVRAEFDDGLFLASATATDLREDWRGDRETAISKDVDLSHARINARFSLSGANCGGAVILHDTRVDGDVLAASTPTHTTRVTHVDASSLKVNGQFDFRTVQFACAGERPCLDLRFAEINGNCYLPGGDGANVRRLQLFHAKLGEVEFALDTVTTVSADGFSFRQLNVPGSDYCRFLEATAPFQRSTYQTVERYLRERGDDRNADLVYREMMRRDRRQELPERLARFDAWVFDRDPAHREQVAARRAAERAANGTAPEPSSRIRRCVQRAEWLWELFLDVTTGRGSSSGRMGRVLIFAFVVMWVLFLNPESVKREYHPTELEVCLLPSLLDIDKHPHEAGKEWGTAEAAFTSLRTVIPLMGDLPHTEWQPSSQVVTAFGQPLWFKFETVAVVHALSYIALPLFLASLSGLLKKRGD
jgi:hypothetical protein